jgi:hypothetical protein
MKKLTIFDIAKILKFDVNQTNKLKKDFENANNESKVKIMETMWNSFFDLLKELSNLKYDQLLEEVSRGKRELKTDLYLQAKKEVIKEFEEILAGKPQETKQMDELRNRLKNLTQNNTPLIN